MVRKNIYVKELKRNRGTFIVWMAIVAFFTLFVMMFYPSVKQMGQDLQALIANFPEGMTRAMGMDVTAWTNILSYYSTYFGMHIMILTSVFSITLSANILSKEEREGTADFLLTRPVTREEVVWSKVAAFFTLLLSLMMLQMLLALGGITIFTSDPLDWHTFATMHLYGLFLNIFFAGLGIFISLFPKRSRSVTGTVVGIVLGTFVINALARISPDTEWIGWISPFKYADFNVIAWDYGLEWWRVLVLAGLGLALFIAAFVKFKRKDIFT